MEEHNVIGSKRMDSTDSAAGRMAALKARYGAGAIPPVGPWNETMDLLLSHRSVRGFTSEPLAEGTVETLVAAAQSAATSSNMQTWSVVAVSDPATKALLGEVAHHQKHVAKAPLVLVFLADLSRAARLGKAEGVKLEGLDYLETFLVAALDAALAAQNAVVAAESLGLATVYLGAIRNDPVRVAEALKLPPGAMAVVGLCVGHGAGRWEVKPRLAQAAVLHRETYKVPDETALRTAYDQELSSFSARQENAPMGWTQRVKDRLGTTAGLHGRDRLREALAKLGFPLR